MRGVIGRTTDAREVTARVVSVKRFISNIEDLLCRRKRGLKLGRVVHAHSRTKEKSKWKKKEIERLFTGVSKWLRYQKRLEDA